MPTLMERLKASFSDVVAYKTVKVRRVCHRARVSPRVLKDDPPPVATDAMSSSDLDLPPSPPSPRHLPAARQNVR